MYAIPAKFSANPTQNNWIWYWAIRVTKPEIPTIGKIFTRKCEQQETIAAADVDPDVAKTFLGIFWRLLSLR